jgi:hypothetical protein
LRGWTKKDRLVLSFFLPAVSATGRFCDRVRKPAPLALLFSCSTPRVSSLPNGDENGVNRPREMFGTVRTAFGAPDNLDKGGLNQ